MNLRRSEHRACGGDRDPGSGLLQMQQLLLSDYGPVVLLLADHLSVERVRCELLGSETTKVHLEVLGPVLEDLVGHGRVGLLLLLLLLLLGGCWYSCCVCVRERGRVVSVCV